MSILLGLHVGRAGARAVAVDEIGSVLASATADYPRLTSRPGWSEQDPMEWWDGSREVLGRIIAEVGTEAAALGLTGQMDGSVFLDQSGEVIRPALLWSDRRTTPQCDEITQRIGRERLIEITGHPALSAFLAPKILWLRDVEPVQYRHLRHVLLPKDYVRFKLTGELATDASDASVTLLLDLRRRTWSGQILAALDIPREWLPAIHESPDVVGRILPSIAGELGLPPELPVAAGAGDLAARAIGSGIVESGRIICAIGDDGALVAHADHLLIDPSGWAHTMCHARPQRYLLAALTPSAGALLRWWRDVLGGRMTYDELSELAESAPPDADALFFLPDLADEGTPELVRSGRGAFVGLRAHHTRAHLTRAVMEGVVFSLRDRLEIISGLGLELRQVRAIGGGARSGFWRQLQADIFNLPVVRTIADEGPAYGAALLAGVAAGVFGSVNEAAEVVRVKSAVDEPNPQRVRRYASLYGTFRQLSAALQPQPELETHRMVAGPKYAPAT